ncbi:hypothetical protein OTU49_006941 [Cherax quadricarinatus]|uniref:TIMELESS-interacting protein n=1 Tax=Cherax quadricarinatus TaxID=27406 RepID=A0AAW0WZE9_CHEQU
MDLNVEELFGHREADSVRDSDSEAEGNEDSDDGGVNNPMEEAVEVPEAGASQETGTQQQPVKPKRVVKNPQPKLDAHRLAGPRGITVLQKAFKDVKFHGKGHEKEDLAVLLKRLEHWAHRLFPKLPFKDTLEEIEKLGLKKNVQVLMKRLRLDMFTESELNGLAEDRVKRGIDEEAEKEEEPQIDIFDELLGNRGYPAFSQTTILPSASATPNSSQSNKTLTDEQKERIERNRRLAEEKRLARLKQQKEMAKETASVNEDLEAPVESVDIFDNLKTAVSMNVNTPANEEAPSNASVEEDCTTGIENMEAEEGEEAEVRMTDEEVMHELAEEGEEAAVRMIEEESKQELAEGGKATVIMTEDEVIQELDEEGSEEVAVRIIEEESKQELAEGGKTTVIMTEDEVIQELAQEGGEGAAGRMT